MTTTSPQTTDTTPRAWLGCLSCYNAGRLVGDWFDAVDADAVTSYDIHGAHSRADSHDELWVFDHENLPVSGELDTVTAASWGRCLAEVDEHLRPALCAWIRSGDYVAEGNSDLPSIGDFEERYCGEWDSFREYAESPVDDVGLLDGVPEEIANYFDWTSWTRDLAMDYSTYPNPDGGVYVFRDL
ncbi:antirestriction protein ArdA [Acidipropionibacterium acidipropionici]|uniref:antirestriction protein ArdA n=1 Tax=Acidipropionibacterium acidipropionici TaxID=1748 RepID=UPI000420778B|nr:antirestriction protein ArdA [Acidipropionibacterium acidipropionici]ALN15764.1 antirestriction protein [Acidipropionibacterium acidipropionici]APZ08492.1 antirestriction protein [Acidipropionibacterium acidipropionici]